MKVCVLIYLGSEQTPPPVEVEGASSSRAAFRRQSLVFASCDLRVQCAVCRPLVPSSSALEKHDGLLTLVACAQAVAQLCAPTTARCHAALAAAARDLPPFTMAYDEYVINNDDFQVNGVA